MVNRDNGLRGTFVLSSTWSVYLNSRTKEVEINNYYLNQALNEGWISPSEQEEASMFLETLASDKVALAIVFDMILGPPRASKHENEIIYKSRKS